MKALAIAVLVGAGLTAALRAQTVPVTLILGEDTDANDRFGTDAILLDSTLVVGAPGRVPQAGGPYGAAYVFRLTGTGPMNGWAQEAVLTHVSMTSTGVPVATAVAYEQVADLPGTPPGSDTEFVVAGAQTEFLDPDNSTGALFLFRRDPGASGPPPEAGWVADSEALIPAGAVHGDYTGSTAALVALGGAAEGGLVAGSRSDVDLVLFERAPGAVPEEGVWSEVARLPAGGHASFADPADLGASASEHGAFFAVAGGGGVRVYRRTGGGAGAGAWAEEAVLTGSEVGPDDRFGAALDAYGAGRPGAGGHDWVLVGSALDPPGSPDPPGGEAYLFRYTGSGPMSGWEEVAVLRASVPRRYFGLFDCVLGTSASGNLVAGVETGGAFLHLYQADASEVWEESGYVDVIGSGASGSIRALWDGLATAASPGASASGTQSGAVWLLDVSGVLSTNTEPTTPASVPSTPLRTGPRWNLSVGPNPARDRLTVRFTLDVAGPVTLSLFDARGRRVYEQSVSASAGPQTLTLDVSGLVPGTYALRLDAPLRLRSGRGAEAGGVTETRWITVVR